MVLLILGLLGGGGLAFVWFSGGSGEPSTDVTAPPLSDPSTTLAGGTATPGTTVVAGATVFAIDKSRSTATFEIDEVLSGQPQQVVGVTSEVAGQISLDPTDASTAQVGKILVNARTIETDSAIRDRAIRGPILGSAQDEFELIEFTPTSIEGLSGAIESGTATEFQIVGDLLIKGTTVPVTFEVSAMLTSEDELEGTAVATVLRSDFGLEIPSVPNVADVSDEVVLTLQFVATAV